MPSPHFLIIAAIMTLSLWGQNATTPPIIVYEVGHGWFLRDKPLEKGQRLSAIAELTGTDADTDLMLNCGKDGLIAYSCTRQPCRVPVCSTKVPGAIVSQVDSGRALRAIASKSEGDSDPYLKRQPKPLAILGVRAGGSLSDTVVRKTKSEIHWAPAFKRVLEGSYCMRLAALPTAADKPRDVNINWDRTVDAEGIVAAAGLAPALYAVEKGTPDASGKCVADPDLQPAWVLVVEDANFESVEQAWKEATAQLNELQSAGASPAVMTTFRHALLAKLADALPPAAAYTGH